MALYRHVRDRDELLVLLLDRAAAELPRPRLPHVPTSAAAPLRNWWLCPPMGLALNAHTDEHMRAMLTDAGFLDAGFTSEQGPLGLQLATASA